MFGLRRDSYRHIIASLSGGSIGGLTSGGGPQLDLHPVTRHVSAMWASCRLSSLGSYSFARSEKYFSVSPQVSLGS